MSRAAAASGMPRPAHCDGKPRVIRGTVTGALFLPSGDAVLTASIDNTVAQWDVQTGRERLPWILKHPDSVVSLAISPDGRRLLTACADKVVRLWDCASGQQLGVLAAGSESINAAEFSPDGRRP